MTSVNRNDNNLSRYQFSCPNWWRGFRLGLASGRMQAADEERQAGHQSEADRQENKAKEYAT